MYVHNDYWNMLYTDQVKVGLISLTYLILFVECHPCQLVWVAAFPVDVQVYSWVLKMARQVWVERTAAVLVAQQVW